jgi:hypothetical protein
MGPRKPELFLVKASMNEMSAERLYRTGETIPHSGIYRVIHHQHRLPHDVTLLKDEMFPRCAQCRDAVSFELLQAARVEMDRFDDGRVRISLYELPELDFEANERWKAV